MNCGRGINVAGFATTISPTVMASASITSCSVAKDIANFPTWTMIRLVALVLFSLLVSSMDYFGSRDYGIETCFI